MPKFSIGQLIFVDRSSPVLLSTDSNTDKDNKLLTGAYGPSQILRVTEHILKVDENNIRNTISIDRATPVTISIIHPCQLKVPNTSLEDRTTIREKDIYTEKTNSPPMLRDSCTETVISPPSTKRRQ